MVSWIGPERRASLRAHIESTAWIVFPPRGDETFDVMNLSSHSALLRPRLRGPLPELGSRLHVLLHVDGVGWLDVDAQVVRHSSEDAAFAVTFEHCPMELEQAFDSTELGGLLLSDGLSRAA